MYNFTTTFPARILEGSNDKVVTIKVRARGKAQAERRAFTEALKNGFINGASDWRWKQQRTKLGWDK